MTNPARILNTLNIIHELTLPRFLAFNREQFLGKLFRRKIYTSSILEKRQSPLTVGVPAWRKASIARRSLETKLRKPKSLDTIKAEMKLESNPESLNLYTTTRIRELPEDKAPIRRLKPEIFMSKDDRTIICFHPAASYPKEKTRESWEWPKWYGSIYDIADYSDTMTEEQESEVKSLRENDHKLWNFTALGHMLKVKPSVISEKFPFNDDQLVEVRFEYKMLKEWGRMRRMDYRKYQNQERIEYVRKSRGEDAAKHFKFVMKI